tara:strand:- start:66 stop:404 length:339 start_codon:yes stop_codon:yes gene_type:complete
MSSEHSSYVRVGGVPYPVITDSSGTLRFPENGILTGLFMQGKLDLNEIAIAYQQGKFGAPEPGTEAQRAYAEFYMMLGYSVSGFASLSSFADMPIQYLSDTEVLALVAEEMK